MNDLMHGIMKRGLVITRIGWIAAAAGLVMLGADAQGQSLEEAQNAFTEGQFREAAEIGEEVATSSGYALAAKAVTIYGYYRAAEDEKQAWFERGMELGELAVTADPNNPEAHNQLAHAMGRYAQTIGIMAALRGGYGGRTRRLLETTLSLDSLNVAAHIALGGWHADIVGRAGGMVARVTYGATKSTAINHYELAKELQPNSREGLLEYALRLPVLQGRKGKELKREMLQEASALPLGDAHDRLVQEHVLAELENM